MPPLLYSEVVKKNKKEYKKKYEKEYENEKKHEKELYSKECVAQGINFVVNQASRRLKVSNVYEKFTCYLATILARDKEVVAVWLKNISDQCYEIYLSKNFDWLDKDVEYINNIMKYLKNISKNAPIISNDNESDLFKEVLSYCSKKIKSRLDKLKKDIENSDDRDIKSFRDFFSAMVDDTSNTELIKISQACNKYYVQLEDKSYISKKFLGHIRKVGSYNTSIKGIIKCAREIQYKSLFSNIKVVKANINVS
ncbi:uncharacterized protein OCT59_010335 [Rhizophagus irregularis]|uniref:uncharacterized protein n=1 Tax=Rhizophagus irregularis TaxID=588596 RepID=UPI0033167A41|nr:hypothetical protein OCT59_010335 [Rhizophagus irregularis]